MDTAPYPVKTCLARTSHDRNAFQNRDLRDGRTPITDLWVSRLDRRPSDNRLRGECTQLWKQWRLFWEEERAISVEDVKWVFARLFGHVGWEITILKFNPALFHRHLHCLA